jgi:putative tryptophan/tyrosine transport system substrate-binding protein
LARLREALFQAYPNPFENVSVRLCDTFFLGLGPAMRRRDFITLIGGAAASWPLYARAQQPERVRRIGVLIYRAASDPEAMAAVAAFTQGLADLGWTVGHNLQMEIRYGAGSTNALRKYATELIALAPDVVLTSGTPSAVELQQLTRTVPIVFAQVSDPVGSGLVESLARPGGNTTGFMNFEYNLSVKWLEVLKQIAPSVTRIAVLRSSANPSGNAEFGAIQAVASTLGVEVSPINVRDASEIERNIGAFARSPNGGLIVTGSASATTHREMIIALAARHKLPAVYTTHYDVDEGGLISYGPDRVDQSRRAAGYVDRILKGEKPADLPVQAPTKYELYINLNTAKALGLTVPQTLLASADKVIE